MESLNIKDNESNRQELFGSIKNLTEMIANKTLDQLEQEGIFVFPDLLKNSEDLTEDQMILQKVNGSFRSGNIMGFLGYGTERLIIGSRFGNESEDFFLQYLLENVLDFPSIVNLKTDADQDVKLFNFFLFLFPHCLKDALRKGPFKQYIHRRYNDENVRGAIDVARHIKSNTPFVGNIAYNQREFSYDNHLTELVRHTIEFISRKPHGSKILAPVKSEARLIVEVTPTYQHCNRQKIIDLNQKNPIRHGYYREYLALQRLCLLILKNQKHRIGTGSKRIYGILFDGAWLWEEYLNLLIGDIFYHPRNKARKNGQHLFAKGVGLIYPDFIGRDPKARSIADAKYKPASNIKNADYFQVLAYMLRFEAKTGYYLYPDDKKSGDISLRMIRGSTYEGNIAPRNDVTLIKHGLEIPATAESYEVFASKMKESERKFVRLFTQSI